MLNFSGCTLIEGLGRGRFSSAYLCHFETVTGIEKKVIKLFGNQEMGDNEISILKKCQKRRIDNVPIIHCRYRTDDLLALVVTPVGLPVLPVSQYYITPRMILDLLSVLEHVHDRLGYVHRDVKPDNIYLDSADPRKIILSDWSSACEAGATCLYHGTPLFGEENVFYHTPSFPLDLCSLVKTAFSLFKQTWPPPLSEWSEIQAYWKRVSGDFPGFAKAMKHADRGDYNKLRKKIVKM